MGSVTSSKGGASDLLGVYAWGSSGASLQKALNLFGPSCINVVLRIECSQ